MDNFNLLAHHVKTMESVMGSIADFLAETPIRTFSEKEKCIADTLCRAGFLRGDYVNGNWAYVKVERNLGLVNN